MDDRLLAHAKGVGGQLQIFPTAVRITRRGVLGIGKDNVDIAIEKITAIRFKRAAPLLGFIQFTYGGSFEPPMHGWLQRRDPDRIEFHVWQQKQFEDAKAMLDRLLEKARAAQRPVPDVPIAKQLETLLELKDRGALSDDEFLEFKRKLLEH
jgi:hypothetical protein